MSRRIPISIEWPPRWLQFLPDVATCRAAVRERFALAADVVMGLGVERWDFTKGIIERFHALEALLDKNPRRRGRICAAADCCAVPQHVAGLPNCCRSRPTARWSASTRNSAKAAGDPSF